MRRSRRVAGVVCAGILAAGVAASARSGFFRAAHIAHPRTGQPIVQPGSDGQATLLHNGWKISPAGRHLATGDMLLGGAFSPDGKTLAIANCGYDLHALHLIDVATEKELAKIPVAKAWNGIAWAKDGGTLYVSGGTATGGNDVSVFARDAEGKWTKRAAWKLEGAGAPRLCVAGLALSSDGKNLFALNNSDNRLYVLDAVSGKTVGSAEIGDHPVTCRLSGDGTRLFVACWGGSEVAVVNVENALAPAVVAHFKTDAHPNDLVESRDGRLFVSCGNADSVVALDAGNGRRLETIKTALTPKAPFGSTPNALALAPDGKTLYAANADNNNICVMDVEKKGRSRVKGFLPTGWYPTAVLVSPDGKKIIVGSGKGTGTRPNPAAQPLNPNAPSGFEYIGRQLKGFLSFVDVPDAAALAAYTRTVYANTPYTDALLGRLNAPGKTAIPTRVGEKSPIKYVLYIVKENRTYDQVFGDIGKGNGDPSLTLFGRDVTPNHHALAEEFVLLDNLYCNGEVSADGHPWSTSAYATDFTQRSWVLSYSGKGATWRTDSVGDPEGGYLWEACRKKGIPFRTYGEYATHKSLEGHSCLEFIGKGDPGTAPPGRDMDKADIFIAEFRKFERDGKLPRFMIMSLGEDHTNGTRPGSFTPKAMVASNDQAVGKIVDAITHSSVWKETAIFVIEDDAQNGPDHVDAHRTVGLVVSPYTKRKHLDSTMYTTCSLLRTMELILGLDPLTQYDAAATPLFNAFTDVSDLTPYTLRPPQTDLMAKNAQTAYGARASARMDFREYDRIDEDALNRILWHSIRGANTPYPGVTRRALVAPTGALHRDTDEEAEDD